MCYTINSEAYRKKKKKILLREFISDVVMSRGNRRFLLTNLQAQIWGITYFGFLVLGRVFPVVVCYLFWVCECGVPCFGCVNVVFPVLGIWTEMGFSVILCVAFPCFGSLERLDFLGFCKLAGCGFLMSIVGKRSNCGYSSYIYITA
jgi:hypothetical protein